MAERRDATSRVSFSFAVRTLATDMATPARRRYLATAVRLVVMLAITAVALMILDLVLTVFSLDNPWLAIPMAPAIWILSFAVCPFLIYVALPLVVLTGGLLSLVLTGLIVWLAADFVDGVHVSGLLATVGLVAINLVVTSLLNVQPDGSFSRRTLPRITSRRRKGDLPHKPGVVFLEIDGPSAPLLRRAIVPSEKLVGAETIHWVLKTWVPDSRRSAG